MQRNPVNSKEKFTLSTAKYFSKRTAGLKSVSAFFSNRSRWDADFRRCEENKVELLAETRTAHSSAPGGCPAPPADQARPGPSSGCSRGSKAKAEKALPRGPARAASHTKALLTPRGALPAAGRRKAKASSLKTFSSERPRGWEQKAPRPPLPLLTAGDQKAPFSHQTPTRTVKTQTPAPLQRRA